MIEGLKVAGFTLAAMFGATLFVIPFLKFVGWYWQLWGLK